MNEHAKYYTICPLCVKTLILPPSPASEAALYNTCVIWDNEDVIRREVNLRLFDGAQVLRIRKGNVMKGLVHLYCGDGKGKTSSAAGLALRCAGAGGKVVFVSFLKDGTSSEIPMLEKCEGISVLMCRRQFGFVKDMDETTRSEAAQAYQKLLEEALREAKDADMIVLDEICAACRFGMVSEQKLLDYLDSPERNAEVVMTGRDPLPSMKDRADYLTVMTKEKHPFDRGISARRGIEY